MGGAKSYNSQTIDGYESNWISISYKGQKGYVFKCYTLPISLPNNSDLDIEMYFNRIWGNPVFKDSFPNTYQFDNGGAYGVNHRVIYKSGEIFLTAAMEEAHQNSIINLNFDIYQAYLWFYILQNKFFSYNSIYDKSSFPTKNISSDSLSIEFGNNYIHGKEITITKTKGATWYVSFTYQNGRINLIWGGYI